MPTLLPMPWPKGPVVVSTPLVLPILRMARAAAVQLAEAADIVQRDGRLARSARPCASSCLTPARCSIAYSSIEAWPQESTKRSRLGQCGIAPDRTATLRSQHVGRRGQGHGRAGMAAIGRLHGVHGQGPDGVDRQLFDARGGRCHIWSADMESCK